MPDDGRDAVREEPACRKEQAAADHGAKHAGIAECHVGVPAGQYRLAEEERDEARDQPRDKARRGHHEGLGRVDIAAVRLGGQRRPDQAGEAIEDIEVRRASLQDTYVALVQRFESGQTEAAVRGFTVVPK